MAPLDADRRRRERLERREREVAAREAELAARRPWRAVLWRARLAPLRVVELVVGSWLVVAAVIAGSGFLAVTAVICGLVLGLAAVVQLSA